MTMHKTIRISAIAAGMLLFTGHAMAYIDDATVNAYAGIAPVLTLTCTDLNFGVWKVSVGSRSAATTITLAADSSGTATSSDSGVALAKGYSPAAAGACDISGSVAPDGTQALVSMSSNTNIEFVGQANTKFASTIAKPTADADLRANVTASTTTPVISNGVSRFYLGGELTIPNNLSKSNYGGYVTKSQIRVVADDKQI
ncbi:hypothetical protein [Plesiomonas sp.]|uniref:hypothetical protein n=1 Tax=Plesiomonas sp. TaxID=2486279 RepID=UPI003F412C65